MATKVLSAQPTMALTPQTSTHSLISGAFYSPIIFPAVTPIPNAVPLMFEGNISFP